MRFFPRRPQFAAKVVKTEPPNPGGNLGLLPLLIRLASYGVKGAQGSAASTVFVCDLLRTLAQALNP
eukprot:5862453-Amphidinium_carterae.1